MPSGLHTKNFIQMPFLVKQSWHYGPPIEEIAIEFAYFLMIFIFSLYIYFKTKEIYELTKHKGIYYFRHIFLYFSFAYFFRMTQISIMLSRDLFSIFIMPRYLQALNFFFVSYFSTMAILSAIISISIRNIKLNERKTNLTMHILSFILSLLAVILFSGLTLFLLQALTFFVAILLLFINYLLYKLSDKEYKLNNKEKSKFFSQNKITYALLFVFWILSTLSFVRRLVPREIKIPLYLISAGIFFSIFLRVRKRFSNAEKKRQA